MTAVTLFRPVAPRQEGGLRGLLGFVRPLLLLAALAFFAGFGGYLILGPPQVLSTGPSPVPTAAADRAIPAADGTMPDWNLPKQI